MQIKGKNIMVTGAAGFIGSHLSDQLSKMEINKLVVLDNMYLGKKENLNNTRSLCKNLVEYLDPIYSTADFNIMSDIFEKENIDIVFDLATIPLPASLEDPKWCFEEITSMAVNLSELCRKGAFQNFVHCSTSEVYGTAEYTPMDEHHPWNSRTSYAAAKGAADLCVKSYVTSFGIDAVIIRPFNTYGPRQNDANYAGVIPIFMNQLLNGEKSTIYGDGNQTRDFTYVTDTAKGFIHIAESEYSKGEIINLAAGHEISINELGEQIYSLEKKKFNPFFSSERSGDVRRHSAGISRLNEITNFQAEVPMYDGLMKTFQWYKSKLT